MLITIVNGNEDQQNTMFDQYMSSLHTYLTNKGHVSTELRLRDMELRYCSGCFGCWVKTPGDCVTKDDAGIIRQKVISSDFTIFASPLIMGFISPTLKMTLEKLIPLLHPYFEFVDGETHHKARYDSYPRMGVIIDPLLEHDEEDYRIMEAIFRRIALNFKTKLSFLKDINDPVSEVYNAITIA